MDPRAVVDQGREILRRMRRSGEERNSRRARDFVMRWSMRNAPLKTQLFRLVDVLPSLHGNRAVAAHTRDYLAGSTRVLPPFARWGLSIGTRVPFAASAAARVGVGQMARTFILADRPQHSLKPLIRMREQQIAFTVDLLGETVLSEREADEYAARYLELTKLLGNEAARWPEQTLLDRDSRGAIPRANVSVKISALYSQIRAAAPEFACERLAARLRPLLRAARERRVFINFDMEHTGLKTLTIDLFLSLLSEPEFEAWDECGIVIQAYLKSAEADLRRILDWAREHGRRPAIRLVKGAYWDTEVALARQRGWPIPVFESKSETDANYEMLVRLLLENREFLQAAFATHNVRSVACAIATAEELGVPKQDLEFQVLYGMGGELTSVLPEMGFRVRQYCPVGKLLPGMAYLVRRLLENTSNEGFLRAALSEDVSDDELLRDPARETHSRRAPDKQDRFQNEPLTDFALEENRAAFRRALSEVELKLGRRYPLVIDGREILSDRWIVSRNPADFRQIIGTTACAGEQDGERAVAAARHALSKWSERGFRHRAAMILQVAEKLHARRFEFAALEVFEAGKPWEDADADVAEAIDFCRYYAQQALRLELADYSVPGEANAHEYHSRGIGVVIAPWNFPLAILCGMTVAGLVTGNAVLIKPAEQSPVVAAWFFELLRHCGFPRGVVQFLPGAGSEIGAKLVAHSEIDWIAFTGSKEVGLKIWETAGRTVPGQRELKKVICEMGGKNAMIIDDDADLDDAIPGILTSAFGYGGQKCSALSRLIVLDEIYDHLLERLVEAVRGLRVGNPAEPETAIGPLIDSEALARVKRFVTEAKELGNVLFEGIAPELEGYFAGPVIVTDVDPNSRIAREEIFGPVLSVFRVRDLDEALSLANDSEFHLTGGLYSRSPANIERVRSQFNVGNLYVNRAITGALVARHPFGGHGMSGGGTKAGGPDYLLNFVIPRTVTENLMRHGFPGEE